MANGMLHSTDTGSGFFIDGVEIPIATLGEKDILGNPYEFDRYGNLKPIVEQQLAIIHEPRAMASPVEIEQAMHDQALQEAELKKASEIAAAGKEYWDAVMQGAIEFLSGGMMSSKPKEVRHGGIDREQGRNKPVKIKNLRGEKPGYSMAEGSNFWSVDEKDPYWQTKQGYEEAINLYGRKPSWVKEPSLEYNPTTGEYDSIKKEEFVDLKPTKRISL
jgi:hypothetical protein